MFLLIHLLFWPTFLLRCAFPLIRASIHYSEIFVNNPRRNRGRCMIINLLRYLQIGLESPLCWFPNKSPKGKPESVGLGEGDVHTDVGICHPHWDLRISISRVRNVCKMLPNLTDERIDFHFSPSTSDNVSQDPSCSTDVTFTCLNIFLAVLILSTYCSGIRTLLQSVSVTHFCLINLT